MPGQKTRARTWHLSRTGSLFSLAYNINGPKLDMLHTSPLTRVGAEKVSFVPGTVAMWLPVSEGSWAIGGYEHQGSEMTKCN